MRVSILIPTLNRLRYLELALASARQQTVAAHEIIVSDDGSTDGTREYIARISAEDPRVRLPDRNPSPGIFTNFNHLVAQSRGDAFCILGDDDLLAPEFVEELSAPLAANPEIVASFCDHRIIHANGELAAEATADSSKRWGRASLPEGIVADPLSVALNQSMCIGFSLFRSSVFRNITFDVECGGAADVDHVLHAVTLGPIHYVPRPLGDYRQHPGTATSTKAAYMVEGRIRALSKHKLLGHHEERRLAMLREALLSHALLVASGNREKALASLQRFRKEGGALTNPRFVVAAVLALSPTPLAVGFESLLRTTKGRLSSLRP